MSQSAIPAVAAAPTSAQRAWTTAVISVAVAVAVYFQMFRDIWPLWMDFDAKTYTHGPLIAGICLWLAWRERRELQGVEPQSARWALPIVLVLSLAWMVLDRASILTLEAALWPVLAWSVVLAATGWPVARRFAFALGFFWFAVPLWDSINGMLQSVTVHAVHVLTVLTRVPAVINGNIVILPQGRFEIASGCSGLHFFLVGLAIAALAGEVHRDRLRTRLLLLGLVAALALVSNWVRVYVIILAGYLTDMQSYLVRVDHYKFGWGVFAVAMVIFFLLLRRIPAEAPTPREVRAPSAGTGLVAGLAPALVAAILLPAAGWAGWHLAAAPAMTGYQAHAIAGFSGPLSPSPAWQPVFHGAGRESRAAYLSPAGRVLDYYGNAYLEQRQGEELVGYRNHLFAAKSFKELSRSLYFPAGSSRPAAMGLRLESVRGEHWVALYRYDVGGHATTSGLMAQLMTGYRSLWHPVVAGIRAVAAPCGSDCDKTLADLDGLLAGLTKEDR